MAFSNYKVIEPTNKCESWAKWKENGCKLEGISKQNEKLIVQFLKDFEIGMNVSILSVKGGRDTGRLNTLKSKLYVMAEVVERELNVYDLRDLVDKERELIELLKNAKEGKIAMGNIPVGQGRKTDSDIKDFKVFWHWHQLIEKQNKKDIPDITKYMDGNSDGKPVFIYITIDQVKKLCDRAKFDYKVLIMFLFDTGIRAPKEAMNVQITDLEWNEKEKYYSLIIKEESSKTFGRKIKLLLCSDLLREYINQKGLKGSNYLFKIQQHVVNQYIKNLAYRVLNIGTCEPKLYGKKKQKYDNIKKGLTMYDFRHCSACYWLVRYKSESALKYRFGWKKSDMIHYYTEFLGMKDTIAQDDLYVDVSKTELENKLTAEVKEREILQERIEAQDRMMQELILNQEKNRAEDKLAYIKMMEESIERTKDDNKTIARAEKVDVVLANNVKRREKKRITK